jgi:large subunit ribosomal protein L32
MPVPKRKVSKSRRDMRSANKHINPKVVNACSNCEYPIISHQACTNCGHYKGRKVITTKYERALKRTEERTTQAPTKIAGATDTGADSAE